MKQEQGHLNYGNERNDASHFAVALMPASGDFLICRMCANCTDSCSGKNTVSEKYWEDHGSHLYSAEAMHYLFHFGD